MSAGPKTESLVVLFGVLVCGQVLAAGQQRLFSPTDEPVSIVSGKSQAPAGSSAIKSCLSSESKPSFRVRFQKLKTKTATFTRTLLDRGMISTYVSEMTSVKGTNIVNCAYVADAGGYVGFSFDGGSCDMFKIEFQPCGCETEAKDVFYVQASFYDPKDSVLPQMVYNGTNGIAVLHLTSSVYDKLDLFVGRALHIDPKNATSLHEQSRLECATSLFFSCLCTGNECFTTDYVDIQHCVQKGCDSTGNTTHLQLVSAALESMIADFSVFYILSECGKTILLGPSPVSGVYVFLRVLSHQGYGCQWYPKTGSDHECVVTFSTGNLSSFYNFNGYGKVFDGNTTTCAGDSLSVYKGAPTNSNLLRQWDACSHAPSDTTFVTGKNNVTIVFKRTAKQYQMDGFNWGFNLHFTYTIDM